MLHQFDLVCDKAVYASLSSSVIFAGWMLGLFIVSTLSDKYGRKKAIYINGALTALCGLIVAFSVDYWMFLSLRSLVGFGFGTYSTIFSSVTVGLRAQSFYGLTVDEEQSSEKP